MADIKSNDGDWLYSETVKEHFFRPKNILEDETKFAADGVGYVGSPACGDMMKVWIKVARRPRHPELVEGSRGNKQEFDEYITDFKWRTFGCASAIGSTSMLSVMVTENGGMKIEDALKLKPQDIMARLGGLPDNKIHCSVLGDKALLAAINDYFAKSDQKERIIRNEAKVICECLNVTDHEIEDAVLEGKHDFEAVQKVTKAGTGCGRCVPRVKELIETYKSKYFGDE